MSFNQTVGNMFTVMIYIEIYIVNFSQGLKHIENDFASNYVEFEYFYDDILLE